MPYAPINAQQFTRNEGMEKLNRQIRRENFALAVVGAVLIVRSIKKNMSE